MATLIARGVSFHVVQLEPRPEAIAADPLAAHRLPVVFLHGLIVDNLSSWYYTVAPPVALHSPAVLYDMRGHGRSERTPTGYGLDDTVEDLFGILDALAIAGPVHLVGNSFGGSVALAATIRRPDRVASLALVEPHPPLEGWAEETVDDMVDLASGIDDPVAREFLAASPRSLKTIAKTCKELVLQSSWSDDLRATVPTSADELASIRCPTLLLFGEHSDILDRAFVIEDAVDGSILRILDGGTHSLLMEQPDLVARHVVAWLDERAAEGTASVGAPPR